MSTQSLISDYDEDHLADPILENLKLSASTDKEYQNLMVTIER